MRIRPRGWLILIPAAVALFLVYRFMGTMSADSLFAANAGCQFALIVLGVIVAVKPQTGVEHPWLVIGLFVVLGGVGMIAAVRQQQVAAKETAEAQKQAAEANAKLATSIENLNKGATEIARVQELNTKLQERLLGSSGEILDQGKVISGLSQKAVDTAQEAIGASTGGESFCYLEFMRDSTDGRKPFLSYFRQYGKSPLYDVEVMVLNLQFFDLSEPVGTEKDKMARMPFKIGNLPVGSTWMGRDGPGIPFNSANLERQDYKINFIARNGWWTQDVLFKKVGDRWVAATRVIREGIVPPKLIFTKMDGDFPGQPDWYEETKLHGPGTEKFTRTPLPKKKP